jgi:hypothetical protein
MVAVAGGKLGETWRGEVKIVFVSRWLTSKACSHIGELTLNLVAMLNKPTQEELEEAPKSDAHRAPLQGSPPFLGVLSGSKMPNSQARFSP